MQVAWRMFLLFILVAPASSQQVDSLIMKTIYLQSRPFQAIHIVQFDQEIAVGRHRSNLAAIMQEYPDAHETLQEGTYLSRKGTRFYLLTYGLIFCTSILLEQMLELGLEAFLVPVWIGSMAAIIYTFFLSFDSWIEGQNKLQESIWRYNNEVWREAVQNATEGER